MMRPSPLLCPRPPASSQPRLRPPLLFLVAQRPGLFMHINKDIAISLCIYIYMCNKDWCVYIYMYTPILRTMICMYTTCCMLIRTCPIFHLILYTIYMLRNCICAIIAKQSSPVGCIHLYIYMYTALRMQTSLFLLLAKFLIALLRSCLLTRSFFLHYCLRKEWQAHMDCSCYLRIVMLTSALCLLFLYIYVYIYIDIIC